MIQVMNNVPSNVAAFRAIGTINKEDYTSIVVPIIDRLIAAQDKINFLFVLDTSLKDFTAGAMLQDLWVGLKHFTKWSKMAIVSESGTINKFTDIFNFVVPGEAKGFVHTELEAAIDWVSHWWKCSINFCLHKLLAYRIYRAY